MRSLERDCFFYQSDTTIHCYEISEDTPHTFPLSHHKNPTALQGLAMLPKKVGAATTTASSICSGVNAFPLKRVGSCSSSDYVPNGINRVIVTNGR